MYYIKITCVCFFLLANALTALFQRRMGTTRLLWATLLLVIA